MGPKHCVRPRSHSRNNAFFTFHAMMMWIAPQASKFCYFGLSAANVSLRTSISLSSLDMFTQVVVTISVTGFCSDQIHE